MAVSQVFTTLGAQTWNWPAGVTTVDAEAIGGGGGGGIATGNPATGGGGKGGSYAKATVTKGADTLLNITVGAGGGIAGTGLPSTVVQSGTTRVSAAGGQPGASQATSSANGAGATTINGANTGTVTNLGGNGGTGNFTSGTQGSGAGGGAGGPTSVGGAASVNVAGTKGTGNFLNGVAYPGAGAAGVGNSTPGITGPTYGGGASGGKASTGADQNGGAGGQGIVVLTWTPPDQAVTGVTIASGYALFVPSVGGSGLASMIPFVTAYWGLEEASGNRVDDIGGLVLAESSAPITGVTGKFGSAASLPGTAGNFLTTPHTSALAPATDQSFMVRFWMKLNATPTSLECLVGKGNNDTTDSNFLVTINNANMQLQWAVANSTGTNQGFTSSVFVVTVGSWYLVHAWNDAAIDAIYLSVNDVMTGRTITGGYGAFSTGPFLVGKYPGFLNYANVTIDDLIFMKGSFLSAAQRTADYNGGAGVAFYNWDPTGPRSVKLPPAIVNTTLFVPTVSGGATIPDIAYDTAADFNYHAGAGNYSVSYTLSAAGNPLLIVVTFGSIGTDDVTGVSWNTTSGAGGTAMTKEFSQIEGGTGGRYLTYWSLLGGTPGTHELTAFYAGSNAIGLSAASYTGVKQVAVSQLTASQGNGVITMTAALTVTAPFGWFIVGTKNSISGTTIVSGGVVRVGGSSGLAIADSNGRVLIGPTAITVQASNATTWSTIQGLWVSPGTPPGPQSVTGSTIGSTAQLNSPSVAGVMYGGIRSFLAFWAGGGSNGGTGVGGVTTGTRGSTLQLFAPTVALAVQPVTGAFIPPRGGVVIVDAFNRADENPLANGWLQTYRNAPLKIVSQQVVGVGNQAEEYWSSSQLPISFQIFVEVTALLTPSVARWLHLGAYVDTSSSGVTYGFITQLNAWSDGHYELTLGYIQAGNGSSLTGGSATTIGFHAGDAIGLERNGNQIRSWWRNAGVWTNVHTVTDIRHQVPMYGLLQTFEVTDPPGTTKFDNYGTGPFNGNLLQAFPPTVFDSTQRVTGAFIAPQDVTILDGFDRADENPLAGSWAATYLAATLKVVSKAVSAKIISYNEQYWTTVFPTDFQVSVDVSTFPRPVVAQQECLIRMYANPTNAASGGFGVYLFHTTAGVKQLVLYYFDDVGDWALTGGDPTTIAFKDGDAIGVKRSGTTWTTWWRNSGVWTQVHTVTDSRLVGSLYAAIGIKEADSTYLTRLDNFGTFREMIQQAYPPTVTLGGAPPQSITGGTIVPTSQLFAPSVTTGPITIVGGTRVSTLALAAPSIATGPVTVVGGTRATTLVVNAPTPITTGPVTVVGGTRPTTAVLNPPSLAAMTLGATIPSGNARFAPTVAGAVTLGTIVPTSQVFAPTVVAPLPQTVTAGTITSGSIVRPATVTTGPVGVFAGTCLSVLLLFAPSIGVGPASVFAATRPSTLVLNPPSVAVGATTVVGGTIAGTQLFPPTVLTQGTLGAQTIPSTLQMFGVTITTGPVSVTGGTVASVLQLIAPSVTTLTFVTGQSRPTTGVLYPPSLAPGPVTVVLGTRVSTLQMFAPSIAAVEAGTVVTASIGSTVLLFAPSIVGQGAISTGPLPSTTLLFAPSLAPLTGVGAGTIGPSALVFAPTVRPGLTSGFVSSTVQLYGPDVAPEIGVIVVGGLGPATKLYPPSMSDVFPPTTCLKSGVHVRYLAASATIDVIVAAMAGVQVRYLEAAVVVSTSPAYSGVEVRQLVTAGVHSCCLEAR